MGVLMFKSRKRSDMLLRLKPRKKSEKMTFLFKQFIFYPEIIEKTYKTAKHVRKQSQKNAEHQRNSKLHKQKMQNRSQKITDICIYVSILILLLILTLISALILTLVLILVLRLRLI